MRRDVSFDEWKELEVSSEIFEKRLWRVALCMWAAASAGMLIVLWSFPVVPNTVVSDPLVAIFGYRGSVFSVPISMAGGTLLGALLGIIPGSVWSGCWYRKYKDGKIKLRCEKREISKEEWREYQHYSKIIDAVSLRIWLSTSAAVCVSLGLTWWFYLDPNGHSANEIEFLFKVRGTFMGATVTVAGAMLTGVIVGLIVGVIWGAVWYRKHDHSSKNRLAL